MERSAAILERFRSLYPREIDLSLDRMKVLMGKLGHPDKRLPPVIHIAGTNGKGSTTAFMRAMLEAAGKTVHVYTSPHLVRFHERIRLGAPGGGHFVPEDALVDALLEVERVNAGAPIPQFEITTAAAFKLFADHPADYTLLEVGLGGRYDATNIVTDPLIAVITAVSMDHEKFFGDTLDKIAAEKAGIIKRERPVVVVPQQEMALGGDRDRGGAARRSSLPRQSRLDRPCASTDGWSIRTSMVCSTCRRRGCPAAINSPMPARRSRPCVRRGRTCRRAAVEAGLANVDWPARLQRLTAGTLVRHAVPEAEIWLDGGHNPAPASSSPRPWPTSKNAFRVRW